LPSTVCPAVLLPMRNNYFQRSHLRETDISTSPWKPQR